MSTRPLTVRIDVNVATDPATLERTLNSIGASRHKLRRAGLSADVLVVSSEPNFSGTEGSSRRLSGKLPVRFESSGPSERWTIGSGLVAFCRAGEMLDPRFLASAARLMEAHGPRAIVHGEHALILTDPPLLLHTPDSRRETVPLDALLDGGPWHGARVTSAELLAELADPRGDIAATSSFWTTQTVAQKVPQLTVPSINIVPSDGWHADDISVQPLALGAVERGLASLSGPAAHGAGLFAAWESHHPVASGPIRVVRRGGRGLRRRAATLRDRVTNKLDRENAQKRLRSLGSPSATLPEHAVSSTTGRVRSGEYARIVVDGWRDMGDSIDVLIMTPRVSTCSGDQIALQYARALLDSSPAGTRLALVTWGPAGSTESGLIPPEVLHYPLPPAFESLTPRSRITAITQLAVTLGAQHALIVDETLAASAATVHMPEDAPTQLWVYTSNDAIGSLRPSHAHERGGPAWITEGPRAAARLATRIGAAPAVRVHMPPPLPLIPDFASVAQYTAAYDDVDFDDDHPFHLLWRTTEEENPAHEVLRAHILAIIDERRLPVRLHVHREVGTPKENVTSSVSTEHVEDHGEFTGGLRNVPSENYHGFLLSEYAFKARPFTLQAMLLGLPIITSPHTDEDVADTSTAMIAGGRDAAALVDAIEALLGSRALRRKIIRGAHDRARSMLDAEPFPQSVGRDLRLD